MLASERERESESENERRRPRRTALWLLFFAAGAAPLAMWGCSFPWDDYDPRVSGASSSSGSEGGGGGAQGATSSSSSGAGVGGAGGAGGAGAEICTPKISAPCYDGPAGTENNAPCKPGVKLCADDGMSWGECLTQVTPALEECGAPDDEDCNGAPNDHCAAWSQCYGASGGQSIEAMYADASGRTVLTGSISSALDFGGGALVPLGGGDVFVASFDASGKHLWSKVFGDTIAPTVAQSGYAATLDGVGNALVGGGFDGDLQFGAAPGLTLTSVGMTDAFIAKLDASGAPIWAKSFGGADYEDVSAVAADAAGNVYIGGGFCADVDFGSGPLTPTGCDGYVVKLSPAGAPLWSFAFGDGSSDGVTALAVDPSGDVVGYGRISSGATFGATTVTGNGSRDVVVAKWTPAGVPVWAKGFGSASSDAEGGAAVGAAGDIYITGFYGGDIDFGCGVITGVGPADLFITKLSPTGDCVWSRGFGDPVDGSERATVAVDAAGNVYVAFEFVGTMNVDGELLSTANPHDVVLIALDDAGNRRFVRRFGDGSDQDGRGVGVDATGAVYLASEAAGTIDFGTGLIDTVTGEDICLAKIP